MRTPEEVALEVQRELARHEFDPYVIAGLAMGPGCTCGMLFSDTDTHDRAILADLIRARDAEARAEALAEVERLTQSLEAAYYALTGGLAARSDSDAWKKSQFARDILRDALSSGEGGE